MSLTGVNDPHRRPSPSGVKTTSSGASPTGYLLTVCGSHTPVGNSADTCLMSPLADPTVQGCRHHLLHPCTLGRVPPPRDERLQGMTFMARVARVLGNRRAAPAPDAARRSEGDASQRGRVLASPPTHIVEASSLGWLSELEALIVDLDAWCDERPSAQSATVTANMRNAIGEPCSCTSKDGSGTEDPMAVLRHAQCAHQQYVLHLEEMLAAAELSAAPSVVVRPAAVALVKACAAGGIRIGVVTSKSSESMRLSLDVNGLAEHVQGIHARRVGAQVVDGPSLDELEELLAELGPPMQPVVLVSTRATVLTTAQRAGMYAIGIAQAPGAYMALEEAGPLAVLRHLAPVTNAVSEREQVRPRAATDRSSTWHLRIGPVIDALWVLAVVAALVVASARLGFALEIGVSVWEFGLGVEALLLSTAVTVVVIAFFCSLVVFVGAAAISGPRAPAYAAASCALFVVALASGRASRGLESLRGDGLEVVILTAQAAYVALIASAVSGLMHSGFREVERSRTTHKRSSIAALALTLAWASYTAVTDPPWWHGIIAGAVASSLFFLSLRCRWIIGESQLYDEKAPLVRWLGPKSPKWIIAITLCAGATGMAMAASLSTNGETDSGLLLWLFPLMGMSALAVWFASTFKGPRRWLAASLPPPAPAVALGAAFAVALACLASFHHGAAVASDAREASPSDRGELAAWYLGLETYWTCARPVSGTSTPGVLTPALLLAAHEDAFVLLSRDSGVQHIPTGAFVLSPVSSTGGCA